MDRVDDRPDAFEFFRFTDRLAPRSAGDGADVDDLRPLLDHLFDRVNRGFPGKTAA